jgi:hypothetical protein
VAFWYWPSGQLRLQILVPYIRKLSLTPSFWQVRQAVDEGPKQVAQLGTQGTQKLSPVCPYLLEGHVTVQVTPLRKYPTPLTLWHPWQTAYEVQLLQTGLQALQTSKTSSMYSPLLQSVPQVVFPICK